MQADLPDDPLVRETMASLGPGAKHSTLDDLSAWIRQLEELCDSQDPALAPALFRTDVQGSCLSTFLASGNVLVATAAQTTKLQLQTKAVKGCPPLSELRMEKVSSNKKKARGEAKLRLSVDRGTLLVLLTITDLDGTTRTIRAVCLDDNDVIPTRHSAATIEVTAVPFAPDQLLERLRHVEAKVKEQRELRVQQAAALQREFEMETASVHSTFRPYASASAASQADRLKYEKSTIGGQVIEHTFDPQNETMTLKSGDCSNPHCDDVDCTAAPTTLTLNLRTGQADYMTDGPQMSAVLRPMLHSFQGNPRRHMDLCESVDTIFKEEKAIREKFLTAKPAEKKRVSKELEKKQAECAKLKDLLLRTAENNGWLDTSQDKILAMFATAKQKDPKSVKALKRRILVALDVHKKAEEQLGYALNQTMKKHLYELLLCKEIEINEALKDLVAVASSSEPEDGKKPDDASVRVNETLIIVLAFVFVLTLGIAYHQFS